MKDSKVTFRLIDFILLNIAIVAVIAVIVFTNVNNMHKDKSDNPTISKEIIQLNQVSAVYSDDLSGYERSLIGLQEIKHLGDLRRFTEPADRSVFADGPSVVFTKALHHVCLGCSG